MSDQGYPEPESADAPYPAVRLLRRHGNTIAIVFEVVPIRWTGIGLG